MNMMHEITGSQLAAELLGRVCQCGKIKGSGKSFCYGCWGKIPRSIQRKLYKSIGDGYEGAYADAKATVEGRE